MKQRCFCGPWGYEVGGNSGRSITKRRTWLHENPPIGWILFACWTRAPAPTDHAGTGTGIREIVIRLKLSNAEQPTTHLGAGLRSKISTISDRMNFANVLPESEEKVCRVSDTNPAPPTQTPRNATSSLAVSFTSFDRSAPSVSLLRNLPFFALQPHLRRISAQPTFVHYRCQLALPLARRRHGHAIRTAALSVAFQPGMVGDGIDQRSGSLARHLPFDDAAAEVWVIELVVMKPNRRSGFGALRAFAVSRGAASSQKA